MGVENVIGSAHADALTGDGNRNVLHGGLGADTISGGAGADALHGGAGADLLRGDEGGDFIEAGAGDDTVFGGIDGDTIELKDGTQVRYIGVDAPDFNLDLERDLKAAGIKTVHFVCPSIWAWRADRVEKIRASTDHVLCIFPFEPELLARHGIPATYVGHPLADVIPQVNAGAAAR